MGVSFFIGRQIGACSVLRPNAPLPRERHKIFAKVYFTDRTPL